MLTDEYIKLNFAELCHYLINSSLPPEEIFEDIYFPTNNGEGKEPEVFSRGRFQVPTLNQLRQIDQTEFENWQKNYLKDIQFKNRNKHMIHHLMYFHDMQEIDAIAWLKNNN